MAWLTMAPASAHRDAGLICERLEDPFGDGEGSVRHQYDLVGFGVVGPATHTGESERRDEETIEDVFHARLRS